MDRSVYSSTFVCDNIARRMLEARRTSVLDFQEKMVSITSKLGRRISEGRIVQRQEIVDTVNRLILWLESADYIANVGVGRMKAASLSTKEDFDISFVLMQSDPKAQWLQLCKGRFMVGRKSFQVKISGPTMRIHRHAISRIIHRESLSPEEFVNTLGDANNLAVATDDLVRKNGGDTALPYRGGLMVGRVREYGAMLEDGIVENDLHFEIKRNYEPSLGRLMISSTAPVTEVMTFVSEDTLTDSRQNLRDDILAATKDRADIIGVYANWLTLHDSTIVSTLKNDPEYLTEQVRAFIEEFKGVMRGNAWQRFKSRPKG